MRVRDSHFALEFVNKMEETGDLEQAKEHAARLAYHAGGGEYTQAGALAKAEQKLKSPEIKAAIAEYIEQETAEPGKAGFSKSEGFGWLAKHIRGEVREEKVMADGEIVSLRKAPSLPALTKYLDLVVEEAPKKLRVESQRVSLNRTIVRREEGGVPSMVARPIAEHAINDTENEESHVTYELSEESE